MRIFKDVAHKLELAILDDNGAFVSGLTITYDVRRASDNVSVASGTMAESTPVYTASITPVATGEYRVLYVTPAGYENGFEQLIVDDYSNFKPDISSLALQATSVDILAKTNLIPASPASTGSAMTLTPTERLAIVDALLLTDNTVEAGVSFRTALRTFLALWAGIARGGGTGDLRFQNPKGTDDRVIMYADIDGNRTFMELLG